MTSGGTRVTTSIWRALACVGLVALAPLFLILALAIKLEGLLRRDARGPVFPRGSHHAR